MKYILKSGAKFEIYASDGTKISEISESSVRLNNSDIDIKNNNIDWSEKYLTFEVTSGEISFGFSQEIDYSIDNGKTWVHYIPKVIEDPIIKEGSEIIWRGSLVCPTLGKYNQFISNVKAESGSYRVKGNIMSLLFNDNFSDKKEMTPNTHDEVFSHLFEGETTLVDLSYLILPATTLVKNCYEHMFSNCNKLSNSPKLLPASELTDYCYCGMFLNCENLKTTPKLLATELGCRCYLNMFTGCVNLTTAPELPSIKLAEGCYCHMFDGCEGLAEAPVLPATIMKDSCYQGMFYNCHNLIIAPELPSTKLATRCYDSMFLGCDNLMVAPELPATTLAQECYSNMFSGCTGLFSAPELPAKELIDFCYSEMFMGCSNLRYLKTSFITTPGSLYTNNWLFGVSRNGDFVKNPEAVWEVIGETGIPENWEILTNESDSGTITRSEFDEVVKRLLFIFSKKR